MWTFRFHEAKQWYFSAVSPLRQVTNNRDLTEAEKLSHKSPVFPVPKGCNLPLSPLSGWRLLRDLLGLCFQTGVRCFPANLQQSVALSCSFWGVIAVSTTPEAARTFWEALPLEKAAQGTTRNSMTDIFLMFTVTTAVNVCFY